MSKSDDRRKKLLTLEEAAQRLGIPYSTLHALTWRGEVTCVRMGRRIYFTEKMLEEIVAKNTCPPRGLD